MTAPCVFLSYSRGNSDYARALHDRLEAALVTVWWDQEEPPGADWTEQLLAWLENAHAVVVVVSQHSAISPSVKNEVLLAQDYQRRVIPVLLEQARGGLWVLIRSLQWVDARDGRDPLPDLLRALSAGDALATRDEMQQLAPPPASAAQAQVTIVLPGEMRTFSEREQLSLVRLIARFAQLRPDQIKIVRVEAGSIIVTLELPESSARWLAALHERQAPLIDLLDIQAVRDLRVLPQPSGAAAGVAAAPPAARGQLAAWLQGWTRRRSLALAGALLAALLVVALANTLRGPALPIGTPVGVVAAVQGTLELQAAGWSAFVPVPAGAMLRAGDRLRLGAGARAGVVCADGTRVELQAGTRPAPCQTNQLLFDIGQARWANAVLGAADVGVPQVVAPRATALLTTTPAIRWTAAEGVVTYTVALRRAGEELWHVSVPGATTLAYPANQAPLEPGPIYRFVVTADAGPEETAQGAGVQVLDPPQAQAARAAARQIEQLGLDDGTTRLLLANLYANRGLYADALAVLEESAATADQAASLQLLGDLHATIGLFNLAIAPYTQALAADQRAGDRPGEAQAHRMLGMVYSRLGGAENRARAQTHYRQALQFYQEVGDANAQQELRQLLADLE